MKRTLFVVLLLLLFSCRSDDPGWKRRANTLLYYQSRGEIQYHNVYYNGEKLGYFIYFAVYSKELEEWIEVAMYATHDSLMLRMSGEEAYIELADYLDRLTKNYLDEIRDKYNERIKNK